MATGDLTAEEIRAMTREEIEARIARNERQIEAHQRVMRVREARIAEMEAELRAIDETIQARQRQAS